MMEMVERDLRRLEMVLPACPDGHPERPIMILGLTAMYGQLNRMLAKACEAMGYPLQQEKWADSQPLTEVAKAYPVVEGTDWFQMHLAAVTMAPPERHPWLDLTAFAET